MNSIEDLVKDLKPVKPAPSTRTFVLLWILFSLAFLGLAFLIRQPFKENTPIVLLLHFVLSLVAAVAALASASPHEFRFSRFLRPFAFLWPLPVVVTILLIPTRAFWFITPRCILASIAWTIPGMLLMMWFFRKGFVLNPFHSILLGSIAAASLGALAQNIVCVELGGLHRVISHTVPAALVAALAIASHNFVAAHLFTERSRKL
ncbi:MAG: NrsF family protein [Spirochaetia bacterium]|nr:NrsF family protein [Spirochaetia bacterium]